MQLALPNFDALSQKELEDFAAVELSMMREEAQTASAISQTAFQRAWKVGKACVKLKEGVDEDEWEAYATQNVGAGDYYAVYRCMRLARMSPDNPPLQKTGSSQYKQLQIAMGLEPAPKTTPRKTDVLKFQNLMASLGCIKRWWREGHVIETLDAEMIAEILEDMQFIISIYDDLKKQIPEAAVSAESGQ
jgi:hypothetical protein